MAELTSKKRKNLPDSSFAIPGKRAFPIHDEAHATAAMRLCHRADPEKFGFSSVDALCEKVRREVIKRFPEKA